MPFFRLCKNHPIKMSCYCGKTRKRPNFGIHFLDVFLERHPRFATVPESFFEKTCFYEHGFRSSGVFVFRVKTYRNIVKTCKNHVSPLHAWRLDTLQLQAALAARVVTSNVVRWVPSAMLPTAGETTSVFNGFPTGKFMVLLFLVSKAVFRFPLFFFFRDFQTGIKWIQNAMDFPWFSREAQDVQLRWSTRFAHGGLRLLNEAELPFDRPSDLELAQR